MRRRILGGLILSLSIFTLSLTPMVFAEEGAQDVGPVADISKPVNVGNKICPVSGDRIMEETKATYEYEGKVYNFCCPACIDEFKKDPRKYIKKTEEELQAASGEKPAHQEEEDASASKMPMGGHESHHH